MRKISVIMISMFLIFSCNSRKDKVDIGKINLEVEIERFDKQLFEIAMDSLSEEIAQLYETYDDFLDIFSYYIINIGYPGEKEYADGLSMFISDKLNKEVYSRTSAVFKDMDFLNDEFADAFKRHHYYFPEDTIPRIVSFVSRFNSPGFTVGNYLAIGLDMYLGSESEYYDKMGIPLYRRTNMIPEKLTSDAILVWENSIFDFNDSVDNILSHIIHQGKMMFLLSKILPDQPDSLLIGFTKDQLKWCANNEEQMWITLIEKKLLFSQDAMDIRKLTGIAPFTYFFSSESPGRAAVWTGWQIMKEYAKRNPELSMKEIMENTDYQEILTQSKYNP